MKWSKTCQITTYCLVNLRVSWFRLYRSWTFLSAVFQTNTLNKNEILAIIRTKYVETFTIFDQYLAFVLRYFNYISDWPILAVQICPKLVDAKTSKIVYFGGRLKCTPPVLPKWRGTIISVLKIVLKNKRLVFTDLFAK